jgi:hypothetical protein
MLLVVAVGYTSSRRPRAYHGDIILMGFVAVWLVPDPVDCLSRFLGAPPASS